MTSIAAVSSPPLYSVNNNNINNSNNNRAKRKFFQRHDPYVKYYHPRPGSNEAANNCRRTPSPPSSLISSSSCTVYGSAFSPSYRNKKYYVACTSNGCISVWDDPRSSTSSSSSMPILSVRVGGETGWNNQVLYDLQFINQTGDQQQQQQHLLVASGDPGILIYKWCDFEEAIDAASQCEEEDGDDEEDGITNNNTTNTLSKKPKCQDPQTQMQTNNSIRPISTFRPHPSPITSTAVEINSTSYSRSHGILFGAAGDAFGCYRWDLASEKLLGTFGGGGGGGVGGHKYHRDYLHVVKTIGENEGDVGSRCVITGGEDGNMGFWDGRDGKLIEMVNVRGIMDKNRNLVQHYSNTSASSSTASYMTNNNNSISRSFMNNINSNNNGSNTSWVSSLAANGNWLAACGGTESTSGNNTMITSRSSGHAAAAGGGFMTLWHLPSRTFAAGCVTRESSNAVAYCASMDCFVSGGNEGRLSFWESRSMRRLGHSWCTMPATYTIVVDGESMVVGGSGGIVDCFVDRVKVSQLQVIS